ncbi:MAG: bifunctional riboflavin kinase/FAD synthetase [Salibacteraceae bacterium]
MEVFRGFEAYDWNTPACVTTGTFDGVHIGHRELLKKLADEAREHKMKSVLVTFDPHPRRVLFPDQEGLQLINTLDEKLSLLESSGLDAVIVQPFTQEFSRTTALLYVRDLLVGKVGMKKLVIGYDHQFGKNREGSIENLKELAPVYEFEVEEIPAQIVDDANVSSTKIRYALLDGNIEEANSYLGYHFYITGKVVRGEGRGSGMGFPTANVMVEPQKIIPLHGVYAADVEVNSQRYRGAVNIGTKPTFHTNGDSTIEVHLLDFNEDLYGKDIRVSFLKRLRNEMQFDSKDALMKQLEIDVRTVSDL